MLGIRRKGDVVLVWKLDRLGRPLKHLIDLVAMFRDKGIEFVGLNDTVDTTTIHGRLIVNLFASFSEFERELISELAVARAKGRIRGQKSGLTRAALSEAHAALHFFTQDMPVDDILSQLDVCKITYYQHLNFAGNNPSKIYRRNKKIICDSPTIAISLIHLN